MQNTNKLIELDTRIQLVKVAISELERAYKADVSRAVEAYQGGNFEIFEIIDIYAAPIEKLKKQLSELYYQREAAECEEHKSFFEFLKSIRTRSKTGSQ